MRISKISPVIVSPSRHSHLAESVERVSSHVPSESEADFHVLPPVVQDNNSSGVEERFRDEKKFPTPQKFELAENEVSSHFTLAQRPDIKLQALQNGGVHSQGTPHMRRSSSGIHDDVVSYLRRIRSPHIIYT